MQGHTQSSESIWTAFNNLTTAYARELSFFIKVAWTRVANESGFAVVGTSLVNGLETVKGLMSDVMEIDKFIFWDETNHLVKFEYDRQLVEPLGGISAAIANLVLENTDGRFTPNQNGTIGTALIPNRPLLMYLGFIVRGVSKTLPVFKGLTRQPKEDKEQAVCNIEVFDFVQYLNEYFLDSTVYENQRTDQIIEDMLITIGFGTAQYSLDEGLCTIPYAYFTRDQSVGERIKQLCEAEEAVFYQDEGGVLRFENRRHFSVVPYKTPVWDLSADDIISWEEDEATNIYNRITIKATPREIQSTQVIYTNPAEEVLGAGETKEIWATFDDPVTEITTPAATTDYTAFTQTGGAGSNITAQIDVVVTLFDTAAKIEVTNNYSADAYLNFLQLRGRPATVIQEISETIENSSSISKYQKRELVVENDFIQERDFALYLARALCAKYATPYKKIFLTVQGIPQIQLRDRVTVDDPETGEKKDYRVMRVQGQLADGLFIQNLTLREITAKEADSWAVVGEATVDSDDEFVGT